MPGGGRQVGVSPTPLDFIHEQQQQIFNAQNAAAGINKELLQRKEAQAILQGEGKNQPIQNDRRVSRSAGIDFFPSAPVTKNAKTVCIVF